MSQIIRKMKENDRAEVLAMMRVFYTSPAVLSNGSEEIFKNDIDNCLNDSPYLEGYIFENEQEIQGYAMVAKSYSTEFGKPCIWIEDLYFKPEYRGLGLGTQFFQLMDDTYPHAVLRLEVEEENERAVHVYKSTSHIFITRLQPYI